MSLQDKPRVLFSLEMAPLGHSGIPHETRLLFNTLSQRSDLQLAGLLMESRTDHGQTNPRRPSSANTANAHVSQFLHNLKDADAKPKRILSRLLEGTYKLARVYASNGYPVLPIPPLHFDDALWRLLFSDSIAPNDRKAIVSQSFKYTNLTYSDVSSSTILPMAPMPSLSDLNFDAVVFQDARPIRLPDGIKRVIRYHDAIPIIAPDLVGSRLYSKIHEASVRRCMSDSFFVCNSSATKDTLVSLFPKATTRTFVIPCVANVSMSSSSNLIRPEEVVRIRGQLLSLSKSVLPFGPPSIVSTQQSGALNKYIICVTTLEPKKNIISIIRAWERVRYQTGEDLHLIVVGRPGWNFLPILDAMKPHIQQGNLHHLQDVPFVELQALYRNAEAAIFPSFIEGFGLPNIEALAAGVTPIVSDIPAHRAVLGEAALFVDPYDVQSIADTIAAVAISKNRQTLREGVLQHAEKIISLYSPAAIGAQWSDFFREITKAR